MREVPDFDRWFMDLAFEVRTKSKDPRTQVGVVIAAPNNRIRSVGYNGFPPGFPEDSEKWDKETKHNYVIHAETNALGFSEVGDLTDHKLYTTLFPCLNCAKQIVSRGIKQVFYTDKRNDQDDSTKLLDMAGVHMTRMNPRVKWLVESPGSGILGSLYNSYKEALEANERWLGSRIYMLEV